MSEPSNTTTARLAAQILARGLLRRDDLRASLPNQLAGHTVLRSLGRGAQAEVLLARDDTLGREVAIKRLLTPSAARFRREVEILSQLQHPNVVRILDSGVDDRGALLYVMDFLGERTLADVSLSPDQARDVVRQVALGCHAAHTLGVVHRDLKPTNILLADRPVVVDFGVAKRTEHAPPLTQTGAIVGTPAYMAPEQLLAHPVDPRTDVYALGVILYELLSGHSPFHAETPLELAVAIVEGRADPLRQRAPTLPPALVAVVERAMACDPDARFPTAAALADALADPTPTSTRRRSLLAPFVALLGGVWLLWPSSTPPATAPETPATPDPTEDASWEDASWEDASWEDLRAAVRFVARDEGALPTARASTEALAQGLGLLSHDPRRARRVLEGLSGDPDTRRAAQVGALVAATLCADARPNAEDPLEAGAEALQGVLDDDALDDPLLSEAVSAWLQRVLLHATQRDTIPNLPHLRAACVRWLRGHPTPQGTRARIAQAQLICVAFALGGEALTERSLKEAQDSWVEVVRADPEALTARITLAHLLGVRGWIRKVRFAEKPAKLQRRFVAPALELLGDLERGGWTPPRAARVRSLLEQVGG